MQNTWYKEASKDTRRKWEKVARKLTIILYLNESKPKLNINEDTKNKQWINNGNSNKINN